MKKFITLVLISFVTEALSQTLPPTQSKGNGEANYSTTFKTNYDTIPVTRSGTTITIGTIPISKGGTGSTTQNFVDLTTAQTVAGIKTFSASTQFPSIGLGAANSAGTSLLYGWPTSPLTGGSVQYGMLFSPVFGTASGTGTSTSGTAIWTRAATFNSAFTLTDAIGVEVANASRGAASAITTSTGLMLRDQTQATNNYGIQNLVSSGANKWGYYGSGTANNVFAGNTRFGSTVAPTATVDITGTLSVSTAIGVASGGTGSSSLTANNVLLGNGASALQVVAPGSSGNVLTSNGTTWTSATPASSPADNYVLASTSGTSFPASTATVPIFTVEESDADGRFDPTTTVYSCNKTMVVEVSIGYVASSPTGTGSAGNTADVRIQKNHATSPVERMIAMYTAPGTGAYTRHFFGSGSIDCVNGDTIRAVLYTAGDSTFSGSNTASRTWIQFKRVK